MSATDQREETRIATVPSKTRHISNWKRVVRRLLLNRGARVGLVILCVMIIMALFAPLIAPYDPAIQSMDTLLKPPTWKHIMGTDDLGRDVFSRVVFGSRISLSIGLISVALALGFGASIGLISGYRGGRLDWGIMRLVDIVLALPGILLALVVIAILGPGISNVMIALGIATVPIFIRVVRGSTLAAREQVYVESALAVGTTDPVVLVKYILPNVAGPLLVLSTLSVADALLVASGLSFLGLGAQPPSPEWGAMLAAGRLHIREAWWVTVFPGVAIALTVLAINLVGDGLRDALDPKSRD